MIETASEPEFPENEASDIEQPPLSNDRAEKRATAALERKRSRQGQRRPTKVVWEEPSNVANRLYLLFCLLVFVVAAALVFVTTILK